MDAVIVIVFLIALFSAVDRSKSKALDVLEQMHADPRELPAEQHHLKPGIACGVQSDWIVERNLSDRDTRQDEMSDAPE